MTAQVLFSDVFSEKDPHLNAVEGLVPLWRLMTSPGDPGTVVQSSLFSIVEGSVSFLLS